MHRYLKDAFFFKHGHALPAIPSYFLTNFQAFFLYQYWGFQPGFLVWNRTILGTNVGGWHLGQSSSGSGCAYRRFAAAQMEVATLTLLMEGGGEKKRFVCMLPMLLWYEWAHLILPKVVLGESLCHPQTWIFLEETHQKSRSVRYRFL